MAKTKDLVAFPKYKKIATKLIQPYDQNARTHSDDQVNQIAASIKEFGFTNPLIIDKDNKLLAGHGRLLAANQLDIKELPCVLVDDLTEDQKKAYIIADNKLTLNSDWDLTILSNELTLLNDASFDMSLTGFSDEELDALLLPEIEPLDDDALDEIPSEVSEPRAKLGDLWKLGEHYLLCGDSTDALQVERLMNIGTPNIMITDPPYGVKLDMSRRGDESRHKTNNKNLVLNDDIADWYDAYVLFPGAVAYVWHASMFTDVVMDGLRRSGFEVKQQIIWAKNNFALGRANYHWKHEPCWYAIKKGAKHSWVGDRKQTTLWALDVPNQSNSKSDGDKTDHPTQKPVAVYTIPIENHTKRNDYIYDPFAGSGTAVIAAQKTGRRALAVELDPKYCDIILERWEKVTNAKANLQQT